MTTYEALRQQYRPAKVEVLLIGESPPDPAAGAQRFFFAPELKVYNLFRAVVQARYGDAVDIADKPSVLRRLKDDGYWLIDATEKPITKKQRAERKAALIAAVPDLIARCRETAPRRGVVICHGGVYKLVADKLRDAGIRVLHDEPIPFPLGNWRRQFVEGFRRAVG